MIVHIFFEGSFYSSKIDMCCLIRAIACTAILMYFTRRRLTSGRSGKINDLQSTADINSNNNQDDETIKKTDQLTVDTNKLNAYNIITSTIIKFWSNGMDK